MTRTYRGASGGALLARDVVAHITALKRARDDAARQVVVTLAPEIQSYMRARAPWQDRSGAARAGLSASVVTKQTPQQVRWRLRLESTSAHGKWVETHRGAAYGHRAHMSLDELERQENAGPLAIIWPTILAFKPIVRQRIAAARRSARA